MKKLGMFVLGFAALLFAANVAQAAAASSDDDSDNKFTIHGEVRFRGEFWNNLHDFTDTADPGQLSFDSNDSFDMFPYRVRLAAKGDLGHDIWVYGEFQNAGVAGNRFSETEPLLGGNETLFTGGSETILYQGYVKLKDIGSSNVDLTIGRQELVFDRGLHFSSLDFYNGISHDGVVADWDWDNMSFSGFWLRASESNTVFSFLNAPAGADNDVLGAHWKMMIGKDDDQDVAAYAFYQTQNTGAITGSQDRGGIYTIGGRWGKMVHGQSGWSWNAEASYQFGDFSCYFFGNNPTGDCSATNTKQTLDQKAWVFEGALGYTWHNGGTDQKVWGGTTWASGDDDPNDQDQSAFTPLYTDFHNRLGYADLFTISNIQAYNVGYKLTLDDKHVFGATYYIFKAMETETDTLSPLTFGLTGDAVADACASGGGISCSKDLGQELDLYYNYNMTENFSFDTAISWFDPGDAVEDHWSGFGAEDAGGDAAWRLTAQARARF